MLAVARGERQNTAYDALVVVKNQFHRAALKRVISVTGVDGDPQPMQWTVLIADRSAPGGLRELQIANGRILADRTPGDRVAGTTGGVTIDTAKLNLDSDGAFAIANHTADRSHTNFESVSYTLRNDHRGTPVWIVTIQDKARTPLGTIHISANRGNVTRVEGMYRGANMANVEQDPAVSGGANVEHDPVMSSGAKDKNAQPNLDNDGQFDESDEDVNIVKARIGEMFRRTKRDAQRLFQRVRRSFDDD